MRANDLADDLLKDLQKVLPWDNEKQVLILIWLHECGGVTRVEIGKTAIRHSGPVTWKAADWPTHYNCFGCSNIETLRERGLLE